jgi:arylformamidase
VERLDRLYFWNMAFNEIKREKGKGYLLVLDYIDLTHELEEKAPMFPGLDSPEIKQLSSIASRGCMLSSISFVSHTGTHMDAPCHFIEGGDTIDVIDIQRLIVRPVIVKLKSNQKEIGVDDFFPYESRVNEHTALIFDTGIDKNYGTKQYFSDYPTLTNETAVLIAQKKPAIVATDAISFDRPKERFVHRTLLGNNIVLTECLTNIALIDENVHVCIFAPLKIKGIDGSPCRALAVNPIAINFGRSSV